MTVSSFTECPKLRQYSDNHSKELSCSIKFGKVCALPRIIMLFHTTMSELYINTNSLSFHLLCF